VLSHPDAQTRLVMILKRDLRRLETTLTQYVGESQRASLHLLDVLQAELLTMLGF